MIASAGLSLLASAPDGVGATNPTRGTIGFSDLHVRSGQVAKYLAGVTGRLVFGQTRRPDNSTWMPSIGRTAVTFVTQGRARCFGSNAKHRRLGQEWSGTVPAKIPRMAAMGEAVWIHAAFAGLHPTPGGD